MEGGASCWLLVGGVGFLYCQGPKTLVAGVKEPEASPGNGSEGVAAKDKL